ncbi:probable lysophospholipase BODYGUARD 3 [Punica granatum]|uniref:Probable lysophospholipase BODYGUARD 3 n=1 Tax=Punica granatum TaxID=22663 RepID=A0A6P8DF70_PUNGR|nr:probable lysophospholipase BODYGUARD 3 [Punica granatum]
MALVAKTRPVLVVCGKITNEVLSFLVFCLLDILDLVLCYVYKVADFIMEAEWRPCYCSSAKGAITSGGGKILVSERGESKVVSLSSSKLMLEEVSDTLYMRPSLVSEVSRSTVKRLKLDNRATAVPFYSPSKVRRSGRSTFTINSTIVEMLQGRVSVGRPVPQWSDCDCRHCTSWSSRGRKTLFIRAAGVKDKAREDVLFIHGFISSSQFWTETLFPNFSDSAKATYRFLAIDLLGFGRSPKPNDSLYTLREHLEMIEQSVLEPYKVNSFHIVAHSLGCILALALAVKHPGSIKSLTLLAPPYYQVPKGAQATQYVMRRLAPRRVWPPIAFGASLVCWYEHITRTACLVICKNHRFWESLTKLVTRNRIRTFLFDVFFSHTHNSAWHTLHNVICGAAGKLDTYLDAVNDLLKCEVTIFHGKDDELIPVECSYNVQRRIPRAHVKVIENKDHITIVVGRQKAFAGELEEIWRRCSS